MISTLDLFSGVGGFSLAGERHGFETVAFCEIDKFARRVLTRHWPGVPIFEDVRQLTAESLRQRGVGPVKCITFGFPCQDVSVAGKRAGLAGDRTGLFWEAMRLVGDLSPDWVVAENVPGLRSSNGGRDMGAVIGAFAERGYVGAWRSLCAQFAGLAQRRERVFFVAGLGAAGIRAVQLVLEGGARYPAPSREAGERVARDAAVGALQCSGGNGRGHRVGADEAAAGHVIEAFQCHGSNVGPADTLRQGNGNVTGGVPFIASGLTARYGKGADSDATDTLVARPLLGLPNSSHDESKETYVAHTLRGVESDASEDGTGRGTPLVAFNWQGGGNQGDLDANEERTGTLQAETVPAIAFTERGREQGRTFEALTNPGEGGRTHSRQVMTPAAAVRRLSATECERLQGLSWRDPETGEWLDGWTCLCGRNRGRSVGEEPCICKDGPRYRAIGNGLAIPVAEWILACIAQAEEMSR